jgi:3-hydroxybutyryl-CoA dehydratase
MGQQLRFRAPVRPGDTVHATVTVKSVDLVKARAVLDTVCRVRDVVVIDGEATVMTTSSVRRKSQAALA